MYVNRIGENMAHRAGLTKTEQREHTMNALISISRALFAEAGFAGVSMEEIVGRAGVTRGALYHHFGSKEGLFRAVLDGVQSEIAEKVDRAASRHTALWDQLTEGCRAFLEASTEPAIQRILLVDAPSVLGWNDWRDTDAANSGKLLEDLLSTMIVQGIIKPLSASALTHLLSGAMNELAIWITQSDDQAAALDQAQAALLEVLLSLKTEGHAL